MDKVVFFLALSVFAILLGTLLLGGPDEVERLRYESQNEFFIPRA
ncbi:MAG: hypothetical protein AAB779_00365 [Patescibacteria group bacterium]